MFRLLKDLRNNSNEEGFTLIELMIVVVIIGILVAIAIPIFANQQKSAIIATMKSDVKNTNNNVATVLTKQPTVDFITGIYGSTPTITFNTPIGKIGPTGTTRFTAVSDKVFAFEIVKSFDQTGYIEVNGSWNDYYVSALNYDLDDSSVTSRYYISYKSKTGKFTEGVSDS